MIGFTGAILACLLLAGCDERPFRGPTDAEMAECMRARPHDSRAGSNCFWMLDYERRAKK